MKLVPHIVLRSSKGDEEESNPRVLFSGSLSKETILILRNSPEEINTFTPTHPWVMGPPSHLDLKNS